MKKEYNITIFNAMRNIFCIDNKFVKLNVVFSNFMVFE